MMALERPGFDRKKRIATQAAFPIGFDATAGPDGARRENGFDERLHIRDAR